MKSSVSREGIPSSRKGFGFDEEEKERVLRDQPVEG